MKGLNIAVHQSIAENVIGTHVWGERMIAVKDFECAICQCLTFEGEEHYGEYCILCGIVVERLHLSRNTSASMGGEE